MLEAGGKSGRVDLVAVRRIRAGDELSFDYGEVYWVCASAEPAAATDSRRESIRLRRAPLSKTRPVWPASAAQATGWPRLAGAWRSLRCELVLKEASGETAAVRQCCPSPLLAVPQIGSCASSLGSQPAQLAPSHCLGCSS